MGVECWGHLHLSLIEVTALLPRLWRCRRSISCPYCLSTLRACAIDYPAWMMQAIRSSQLSVARAHTPKGGNMVRSSPHGWPVGRPDLQSAQPGLAPARGCEGSTCSGRGLAQRAPAHRSQRFSGILLAQVRSARCGWSPLQVGGRA